MSGQSERSRFGALLRQDLRLVDFGARRFRLRPGPAREQLESSAKAFIEGLNASVSARSEDRMVADLDAIDAPLRGFAFEGAGMGCALLDVMSVGRGHRTDSLLAGPGRSYSYLIYVGTGWAYAKLRLRPSQRIGTDPLSRWLAWDGFGFHQGFFHSDRVVGECKLESRLGGDRRAVRDQGLGRSLWFHECADPDAVALRIAEFPRSRRGDLWAGIGLAATYAGGVTRDELERLAELAGAYRAELVQGCAFACGARQLSGVVPSHADLAASVLAGSTVAEAAAWTEQAATELGRLDGSSAQYQQWRAGIRRRWEEHAASQRQFELFGESTELSRFVETGETRS